MTSARQGLAKLVHTIQDVQGIVCYNKHHMVLSQEMLDYIRGQNELDISREEIKGALMTRGWSDAEIEEGFGVIDGESVEPTLVSEKPIKPSRGVLVLLISHVIFSAITSISWLVFMPRFAEDLAQAGLAGILFIGIFYFLRFALIPYIILSSLFVACVIVLRRRRVFTKKTSAAKGVLLVVGLHVLTIVLLVVLPKPYVEWGVAGGLPVSTKERCPAELPQVMDNPDSPPPYTEEVLWASQFGYQGPQESYRPQESYNIRSASDSNGNVYLAGLITYDANRVHCNVLKESGYVVRYDEGGDLDSLWSDDGLKVFRGKDNSQNDAIEAIAVDGRDNLYVLWMSEKDMGFRSCQLQRFLPSGEADMAWGNKGTVALMSATEKTLCPRDMHVDGGEVYLLGATAYYGMTSHGFIMKLNSEGRTDTSWGDQGLVVPDRSTGVRNVGYEATLMIDSEGALIAETNKNEFVRLLPDGQLDQSWGDGGVLTMPSREYQKNVEVIQAPNKTIVVAEISEALTSASYIIKKEKERRLISLSKYNPKSGQLDSSQKIIILPKIIDSYSRMAIDDEYAYLVGTSDEKTDYDGWYTYIEKYDLETGELVLGWGEGGVKKYGSWDVMLDGHVSGITLGKDRSILLHGETRGNLGGPSCNGPWLSCGASYGYVVKVAN